MYFDSNDFATCLQTLRKTQGMTQEEMAEALNISLEHLSKMERGKRKPSIDLIVAMTCYFHVSTDYLLMGKDCDMEDYRTRIMDVVT
ncbi:MAG: helix-turn-helix transcriptional regulator [Clostridiales bacterium]|nr:helix-turn-helix transcriptional regulator [Clostridiales bacterium]